ncbi:MAG: ribosome recycling factor [Candidatus Kapabacteria bacterium]|nr:ribosome recycling factor [Candidatus Kapabacteria bacterium]MDW7996586.1 ribosome recycling factor [Bacteroidota bacterium]MDW8226012.1 ribosome recycling factor [Bacteroidota bacterium]
MPIAEVLTRTREHMAKTLEHFQQQLARLRTGRATPALIEHIRIEYYGVPTPITQVGTITVPEPRMLVVQPWDRSLLSAIEKAILQSDIGVTPNNDGSVIRIVLPPLSEERRRELVRVCKKYAEEARVAIRNIRRDHIEELRRVEKEEHLSEDERRRGEQELQKITDKFMEDIERLLERKEKEILEE